MSRSNSKIRMCRIKPNSAAERYEAAKLLFYMQQNPHLGKKKYIAAGHKKTIVDRNYLDFIKEINGRK